jgi:hypothetical protein
MADDKFTSVHNEIGRGAIPVQYVGVYVHVAGHREGWKLSEHQLAKNLNVGRSYVRSAIAALEQARLLVRDQVRSEDGRRGDSVWWITDLPLQLRDLGITDEDDIADRVQRKFVEWCEGHGVVTDAVLRWRFRRSAPVSENRTTAATCGNVDQDESLPRSEPLFGKPTAADPTTADPTTKKTKNQENQGEETYLPAQAAADTASAAVVEAEGQEAEPSEDRDPDPAAELVAAIPWPTGWRLDARTRRTLRELAVRCLQAGHPPAVVAAEAAAGIPGATGPGAAVARLRALAEAPPDGVDVAAARRAAERAEREHMTRTPHPFEAGRSRGYCGPCGRYESNAVHTTRPISASRAPAETHPDRRCPHGRRPGVCLDCRDQTSPTATARPPAPRRPVEPERSGIATLGRALAELQSPPTSEHPVPVPA